MSKINRPPLSVSRLARHMKKAGREDKIAVVVGTLTDDPRIFSIPKITVCLLNLLCLCVASGSNCTVYCRSVPFVQLKEPEPEFWKLVVKFWLLINLPCVHQLASKLFWSKAAVRPEKPTSTSARLLVFQDHTPSPWFAPKDANLNVLVVVGHPVDIRNKDFCSVQVFCITFIRVIHLETYQSEFKCHLLFVYTAVKIFKHV